MNDTPQAQAQTPQAQPTATTTTDREQRERERERQYRLDTIIARYVAAYTAWQGGNGPFPAVKTFTVGMSVADAAEVLEFALYLAGFGDTATIDAPPDLSLSPAGERAMAAIRAQHSEGQA